MNNNILELLENRITLEHQNFKSVFTEILCKTQHGRKDEVICVIGPSGIGKSTMQRYLADYLTKQQAAGWKDDHFPPILIEAPSSLKGEFPWRSFLEDLLEKLGDLHTRNKIDLDSQESKKRDGTFTTPRTRLTIGQLEKLLRTRIKALKPVVIFIDECQNFVDQISNNDIKSNINRIKNWANTMDTKFMLFGTHEAKELLNLNEQLARRVVPIYFPRYQRESESDIKAFAQFYISLIKRLEIKIDSKVHENFLDIYDYSLGCSGLLVSWIHNAISHCISNNSFKITPAIMKKTRHSRDQLVIAEKAIKNFELFHQRSLEDFNPNEVYADNEEQYQPDLLQPSQPQASKKRNLKPGQQHPKYHKVHENRFD
jgi:ABC-type taurine transport system ATPase subunit